ncbi:hypothetical protein MJO28_014691 [Puccinia striiformis f. sp. tritici]|uniref:Fe2OG dioxygenase domain-containing protein n=6 Tax=Puccinia striiformis TaxID=27350 RepID=A0A0L0VST4_9BASI|nr:hypothetical protein Pst134EB_027584 [Puccinia striiformis f. sp. tritici]KNF02331.1 hypothetical protein PSTG_04533 [Puccinia striiformis f. sp. tritici PST-78]POW00217.1 hypothetical protein PSTT_13267 [Puccinia striiformis]KAI7934035.1 hypothetical protein MJO29_016606 [Puccinia striiformis f. sp. tritici]KAI7939006.1 hypothetical protein MJO28_014585 [Puccinia striiformis f. sp. tritici]
MSNSRGNMIMEDVQKDSQDSNEAEEEQQNLKRQVLVNTNDHEVIKPTTKSALKKLEKMRKNYHLSRSLQPDYQEPQSNPTPFRAIEQYYKRRLWEPDYNLGFGHHSIPASTSTSTSPIQIEWSTPQKAQTIQVHIHTLPTTNKKACPTCSQQRILCTFPKQYPGLIYLPSYLCQHQQADLVQDCLTNGLRKPNVTNLDTHWEIPSQAGIYELYRNWLLNSEQSGDPEPTSPFILTPKTMINNPDDRQKQKQNDMTDTSKTRRQKVDFEPINSQNFLVARNDKPKEDPICSKTVEPIHIRDIWMNGKLRWCTIGWQYHWPTKTYHFEREPTPISELIESTCKNLINHSIPWKMIEGEFMIPTENQSKSASSSENWRSNYKPEAGVINFYQYRDSLTAHIDHSEVDTEAPLVSLSVGQACIFLISASRDEEPLAIKLESGDGLIMSGPSRRFFHGVPRIIEHSLPSWFSDLSPDLYPWAHWFRNGGRINLNVRQVF